MKLTQTAIAKLTSSKPDEIFFDDDLPRFGVRLREGGSRKYVVQYRQGGIKRRHTIGHVGTLTLEEARKRARKVLVAVDDGRDPAAERESKRAAASLLFASVAQDYLRACEGQLRARTIRISAYHLTKLWKALHRVPVGAIGRQVIAAHLRSIAGDNGAASANRARSTLSAMFAWAIGEGLCENNPVIGTNTLDEKPRERVLSDMELAAIWKACPDSDYGRIVKLLMLTGQRREEIGALRWAEIDLNERQITLAGERTKNGVEHRIPLSDDAMKVLQGVIAHRDLVFGARGNNGFANWHEGKTALDNACGVKNWTLHDLRRTAATRMADIGVQPHIIEAVLNHVSGHKAGVAGIYNRSSYSTEKRDALERWANHLAVAIAQASGANVVKLVTA